MDHALDIAVRRTVPTGIGQRPEPAASLVTGLEDFPVVIEKDDARGARRPEYLDMPDLIAADGQAERLGQLVRDVSVLAGERVSRVVTDEAQCAPVVTAGHQCDA